MVSERLLAMRFSLGLAVRAAAVPALCYMALRLAVSGSLYAVAMVVMAVAGLVFLSLWRAVTRADRMLAQFVEGAIAGCVERPPAHGGCGFAAFSAALERAAEALRSQRQDRQRRIDLLSALVDSVPAALIVIDGAGGVTLANRAARSLAGQDIARLADIEPVAAAAERLLALAPGGRTLIEMTDGRLTLASAIGFTAPGSSPRRLLCLQDVAQLDAVEMKAWQDVVRVLAHEMLNSLTPIVSLAESLQHGRRPKAEVAAAIEVIGRRSRGLMTFVDRYRQAAQIPVPSMRPVPIRAFLASLEDLLGSVLKREGLVYESLSEPDDLIVMADPDLLEQAAINLVKNAAEAVATVRSPSIRVHCRVVEGWAELTVADNGVGITRHDLPQLFVPFFTRKAGGSGIGLSIARQIAAAHCGRLDFTQVPRGGTCFAFAWPAVLAKPSGATS